MNKMKTYSSIDDNSRLPRLNPHLLQKQSPSTDMLCQIASVEVSSGYKLFKSRTL